jgi:DNA-binding NarL/FixJ family response regulator
LTPNRLLLIARSPVFRFGIQILVESSCRVGEIAEAENTLDVYTAASRFGPDLVIMQDALPGVTGMTSARMIRQLTPAARVIVLADNVELAERTAGGTFAVDALLPTAIEPDDLTEAIRRFDGGSVNSSADQASALEIAVLDGIAREISLEAIAAKIESSHESIANAFQKLLARFNARDGAELIAAAVRRGWIDPHTQLPDVRRAVSFAVAA